jgi:hypothetical protein
MKTSDLQLQKLIIYAIYRSNQIIQMIEGDVEGVYLEPIK